jgi:hypothetical protein
MNTKKIEIGQLWSAIYYKNNERLVGYTFEIIRKSSYSVNNISKTAWLALKLYVDISPEIDADFSHCYWFDEHGIANLSHGTRFTLIRKRKPNAPVQPPAQKEPER